MNQENILRSYTRLLGLRKNIPEGHDVKETYVNDYHQIVDILASEVAISLDEFKIPQHEVQRRVTSFWPAIPSIGQQAGRNYSEDQYCECSLFLSKIDALLSYFEIKYLSKDRPQMGFRAD